MVSHSEIESHGELEHELSLERESGMHLNVWRPKHGGEGSSGIERVILLLHGLMMHGRSFERLAGKLAESGALVVAPDLRGFGRSHYERSGRERVDHKGSMSDLSLLASRLKDEHPSLPLYCAGESLGLHFARRLAASHPDIIAGLVLASPCLRPRMLTTALIPHAVSEMVLVGLDPKRSLISLLLPDVF